MENRVSSSEFVLGEVEVMFVEATGPEGGKSAFGRLESKLSSLRRRKFYGTYQYPTGPYRACVALQEGDNPDALGLSVWAIPGGKYARRKLVDWQKPNAIPDAFADMAKSCNPDSSRPSIEFYRSQKEAMLFLPIN